MEFSQIQELLQHFGLDAGLYGTAVVLAIGLRFARAYWRWCDDPHTLGVGALLGLGGAGLFLTMTPRPWQAVVLQGLSLSVVVLLGERMLRAQAGKFGLPHDNEWADDHQPPPPADSQGGFMRLGLLFVIAGLALALLAVTSFAAEKPVKVYGGLNGLWYDAPAGNPSELEAGVTARASLQPHISLVGSAMYGFESDDIRTTAGWRVTVSDVENPNFSIGVGMQYRIGDGSEWQGETTVGWRPGYGEFVLGAQGFYGLKSNEAGALIAVRHPLFGF